VGVVLADESLRVTLTTPVLVHRSEGDNIIGVGDEVSGFLGVSNKNDFEVKVVFSGSENIKIHENNLILSPGEDKKVGYTVKPIHSGTNEEKVVVVFSTDREDVNPKSFNLVATIKVVDVQEKTNWFLIALVLSFVFLAILGIWYFNIRRKKKQ